MHGLSPIEDAATRGLVDSRARPDPDPASAASLLLALDLAGGIVQAWHHVVARADWRGPGWPQGGG